MNRLRDWCGYGLLWGFALMTNGTLLALLPFLLGWLAYRRARESGGAWLARPALAVGGAGAVLRSVDGAQYAVFHSFVLPLRSVLGLQLWLGITTSIRIIFRVGCTPSMIRWNAQNMCAWARWPIGNEKRQEAVHWMATHPWREVQLFAQRFTATWLRTPHPVRDFLSSHSFSIRAVFVCEFLVAIGALAGVVVSIGIAARADMRFPSRCFRLCFLSRFI